MKTKQEQIDEMHEVIYKGICSTHGFTNTMDIATAFYNAGYRKVPEYAVIIPTQEREEEMKEINKMLAERDKLKAEIECLKAENEKLKMYNIKDFVEKLKTHGCTTITLCRAGTDEACVFEGIDELLKGYEE